MASKNRSSKKPQNQGINDNIKLVTACIAMAIISGIFLPYLKKKITNIISLLPFYKEFSFYEEKFINFYKKFGLFGLGFKDV